MLSKALLPHMSRFCYATAVASLGVVFSITQLADESGDFSQTLKVAMTCAAVAVPLSLLAGSIGAAMLIERDDGTTSLSNASLISFIAASLARTFR